MRRKIPAAAWGGVFLAVAAPLAGCSADSREHDADAALESIQAEHREEERRSDDRMERWAERLIREDQISEDLGLALMLAREQAENEPTELNFRRAELARARSWIWNRHRYRSNGYDCPPAAPVKGNWSIGSDGQIRADVYHLPGWVYYGATIPEGCFESARQARKAGYRASMVRR